MITKDTFLNAIRDAQTAYDYTDELNDLFEKYHVDGVLFQPNCVDAMITVLEEGLGLERDQNGNTALSTFCYEENFGRSSETLSTPEKLWDHVTGNREG